MEEIVAALEAEQEALAVIVAPLDRDGLLTASRCAGWTVADVLLHLAQTNELASASARGELAEAFAAAPDVGDVAEVEAWADASVDAERPADPSEARDRWVASAAEQVAAFAACEPSDRVMWVAGELAARSLASTRLSETWIHAGDIAAGLGLEPAPTGRLWHVARLAHRTLPHAFARRGLEATGEVAFVLTAPGGGEWVFGDPGAPTVISGPAVELCEVAAQRADASGTSLSGRGPDAARTLEVVRTFA